MKHIEKDGFKETTFIGNDADKTIVIGEKLKIDSHLKHNKELANHNDGYSKSRELKRVASIPILALQIWAEEYNGNNNWWALPKETQKKILKKKLNSNEYSYFKTAKGNL